MRAQVPGLRGTAGQVSRLPMTGSLPCSAFSGVRSSRISRITATTAMTMRARTRVDTRRRIRTTVAWPRMATATVYSAAPIFPTTDLGAMQAHYEALGFAVHVHQDGYATASRDGVKLHFRHESDPAAHSGTGAAYLAVDDADALHAEWVAAGVGETSDLFDPGFGVWEAAHTDPDGNLLRFGSPLRDEGHD